MPTDNTSPRIVADESLRGGRRLAPRRGVGVGIWLGLLISLLLLGTIASASFGWWAWQEWGRISKQLETQNLRVEDIEQILSVTSEDLSQSGKQIGERIDELYSEVDKLWASAWRRNKAAIDELREGVDARAALLGEQARALSQAARQLEGLDSRLDAFDAGFDALRANIDAARTAQVSPEVITELREALDTALDRIADNAAWVDGINEWRTEYNSRLLDLQSGLESLVRPAEEEEETLRWQEVSE